MNDHESEFEEIKAAAHARRAEEADRKEAQREKMKGVYLPLSAIRELGVEAAPLYCYLLKKMVAQKKDEIILAVRDVEKEIRVGDYKQRKILKELVAMGYLKTS